MFVSAYEVIKISLMNACAWECGGVLPWWLLSTLPLNRLMKSGCNVYSSSRNNEDSACCLFLLSNLLLSLSLSFVTSFWAFSFHFAFVCCHVNFQLRNLNCIDNNNNKRWNIININEVNIKCVCVCVSVCRALQHVRKKWLIN